MKNYISSIISFFKRKNKERKDRNCKKGKHSWMKNPYWYMKDEHGNYEYASKIEFSEITSWFTERFYKKCSHCGCQKNTRTLMRYD